MKDKIQHTEREWIEILEDTFQKEFISYTWIDNTINILRENNRVKKSKLEELIDAVDELPANYIISRGRNLKMLIQAAITEIKDKE